MTPAPKWTVQGLRWTPDGLQLLDRFGRVVLDYRPLPHPVQSTEDKLGSPFK